MMDSLMVDLRSGVEEFEVTFKVSSDNSNNVAACSPRRVEDAVVECGQRNTCPDTRDNTAASFALIV
jgi:hypothetical protein